MQNYKKGIWDLSDLVKNPTRQTFDKKINEIEKQSKKFTKNKVLVTYEQKCDDEFVFTYNYGHNNELYEKLTDLNVNDYDHLIINDDIEKRRFEIVVKFKKSNTCNHDSCKDEELDDSKSYEGDIHESKKDNNEDVQSSVGDSEENAKIEEQNRKSKI